MNANSFVKNTCVVAACWIALAAAPVNARPQEKAAETSASKVLADAIKGLEKYSSITADLRESVTMGTRQFTATGSYVQGSNNQLRLNLEIQAIEETAMEAGKKPAAAAPKATSSKKPNGVLQVSDGRMLWTQWTLDGKSRVERRDMQEITKAFAGSKRWTPQQLVSDMGLGGVPALLTSMQKRMDFSGIREEEKDGTSFIVVQGRWNAKQIAVFAPRNTDADPILAAYLPEYVRIFFEKKTLFPRRIMFLKRHPDVKQRTARPMVTLDLTNVELNGPIDPEQFRFAATANEQTDITEDLIKAMKLQAGQVPPAQPAGAPAKQPGK